MITKHCVRFSMSLCPKQAKGVIGVKGTIKAEPLQLINGKEKLTLRFDCKPCEMHVVGKIEAIGAEPARQGDERVPHAVLPHPPCAPSQGLRAWLERSRPACSGPFALICFDKNSC